PTRHRGGERYAPAAERSPASSSRRGDESGDDAGELRAFVLLQEVSSALDLRVVQSLRALHVADELTLAAFGDRVAVAERTEEWLLERVQHLPCLDVRVVLRIIGRGRYERRERAGAGLVGVVGERCVVRGNDV